MCPCRLTSLTRLLTRADINIVFPLGALTCSLVPPLCVDTYLPKSDMFWVCTLLPSGLLSCLGLFVVQAPYELSQRYKHRRLINLMRSSYALNLCLPVLCPTTACVHTPLAASPSLASALPSAPLPFPGRRNYSLAATWSIDSILHRCPLLACHVF